MPSLGAWFIEMIILLTRDLFFGSKVTSTANSLGLVAKLCGSREQLESLLATQEASGVILDLSSDVTPGDVRSLLPIDANIRCVAFGPHVDTDKLAAAKAAGFDDVLPRSRFSAELPQLLQQLAASDHA
ncbi:hypothetical protein GC163_17390 [bacterium]|nr:hypothetical protein [bacterium]